MKSGKRLLALLIMAILLLSGSAFGKTVSAPAGESDDRTLSPYFFVKSDDPTVDRLPLKSTTAHVNISGVIADVQVAQVYKNEGKKPLEALYIFPASTRAAVYAMKMTIGTRVINARVDKREDARRGYEQAREQGRRASLLEQQRPNVFQMNVANIMPGDEIKVEMKYTELLVPTDRVYEFVYPTVVGPRYSNQAAESAPPSERWVQNPYLHEGEAPTYTFGIDVNLAAGLPIRDLTCASHKTTATYDGPSNAKVVLDKSETQGGNRDYILRYRLDGDRIQSGLLLYQGEKENFFLCMLQPPKRLTVSQMPGREYIFIVDVSGSMHGFPIEISKSLLKNLIGNLRPSDVFNLLLFSGGSSLMAEQSVAATPANIQKALTLIDREQGGGGTELLPALTRALKLKKPENYSRTVVIATDGFVTVEEEVFDLIRQNLGNGNIFTFGIGTGVNRHIIEGMARVGMGEPFVISKAEQALWEAERFRRMIESPVLTRVKVGFEGFATYDVEPITIPDVLAERPIILFGKWRGKPHGKITVSGVTGEGQYTNVIDVGSSHPSKNNSALRYLWARHRITLLSDYNKLRSDDTRIKEVTDLGLTYNLLTAYTSFVAIDSEVANRDGKAITVAQPLPLPHGVSDLAVGQMLSSPAYAPIMGGMKISALHQSKSWRADASMHGGGGFRPVEPPKMEARVSDITVSEGLSKEAVLALLKKHLEEIDLCGAQCTAAGKLVLKLTIASDGSVKAVKVVTNCANKTAAEACLTEQAKTWRFPATKGGREVTATVTLVFGA